MINELEEKRNSIDEIDQKLVELLEKRFLITDEIGKLKKKNNIEVNNPSREKDVIQKISKNISSKNTADIVEIFQKIFKISKNRQNG